VVTEFALIDRIIERLGDAAARDILVPPGDDSAVWIPAGGAIAATTDTMTEGTHWRPHLFSMEDVGWRAVATSVSDLAAMGATPEVLLVAAILGPGLTIEEFDATIDGMAAACRQHGVRIAGGDIVRGRTTAFTVTAIGATRLDRAHRAITLRRNAAHVGDAVAVSGTPGAAAAGLRMVERGMSGPAVDPAIQALLRPVARIALGLDAVAHGVLCAIDISDGLIQDLGHIALRSGVGIEIDLSALPLSPAAVSVLGSETARELALSGGDDYELALVGRAAALDLIEGVTIIGRIVDQHPGEIIVRQDDGSVHPVPPGWDALRDRPLPHRS
jgi:thiamine-monophosphate kinase